MMVALGWILFGVFALAFAVITAAKSGWDIPGLTGLSMGTTLGVMLVLVTIASLKQALRSSKTTDLTKQLTIGMMMKMGLAVAVTVLLMFTKVEDPATGSSEFWANPTTTLMSYLGIVFFGFAWQARMVEAPAARQPPASTPDSSTEQKHTG
jgi:hypothetical protein